MINAILACLLAFCLSIDPGASWDCHQQNRYTFTCDSHTDDSYYAARLSGKHSLTIYHTDGDSYQDYIATMEY